MLSKINKFVFYSLVIIFAVTFFTKNNYRNVDQIAPEVLGEPIQTKVIGNEIIKFTRDDYEYELTPLFDYEINGLIAHKMDYTWFSIHKRDSVFPVDLCLIWGDNVRNRVYQEKSVHFSQDFRFCLVNWTKDVGFNLSQMSNSHLVINNEELEKKLKLLSAGDQVKIRGKLANIVATNLGQPGQYDPEYFEWRSSANRSDSGAGACEVIYVDGLKILKKGNPISFYLNKYSFYGIVGLVVLNILIGLINMMKATRGGRIN